MTDQHRATPEQLSMSVYPGDLATDPRKVAVVINALSDRIEALEAAQLAHRIQSGTLTSAERAELGVVPVANMEAAARRAAAEARDAVMATLSHLSDAEREQAAQDLASPAAWRPLDIETTYVTNGVYTNAAQILRASMVVEGTFDHGGETYRKITNRIEIEALERNVTTPEPRAASAEARPVGGLVERVRRAIGDDAPCSHSNARAAIREVAAWLRENDSECQMGGDAAATAELLEQESNQ